VAKSYEDLVTEARQLLQDTNPDISERFTDAFLINQLNRGLQELGRIRPDAFIDLFDRNSLNVPEVIESGTPVAPQVIWTDDIQFEGLFYTPLVFYITGSSEITDDEFTMDGRAGLLLGQFKATVIGI
jgi:hypothetical protein